MKQASETLYGRYLKRFLDILLSSLAIVVLSPVYLIVAVLIKAKLGSPVIFRQARPGKGEKIFQLYKFRSMTDAKGSDGRLLSDSERLTKLGKFLRTSSLDELPELINIFKGDMSIVGPRPLSIFYLPHYPVQFRRRHHVRPGLTGLAQVNGRNNLDWDARFSYDVDYVDHLSFRLDLQIIFQTFFKVLNHSDITVRGSNEIKDYGPYQIVKEERRTKYQMKEQTTYSEIGSYFWLSDDHTAAEEAPIHWLPTVDDSAFTFSGRSAIEVALKDILSQRSIHSVYVPSYCCISMLQPFIDRGLKVKFYDIALENGRFMSRLPNTDGHSLILIMSYFGLDAKQIHSDIHALHQKGTIVIEDITHSLLRKDPASDCSDYLIASLRKWFAIPTGGWVGKKKGMLSEKPSIDSNQAVAEKIAAMREKYRYLTGQLHAKDGYLEASATFENDLIHADHRLKIDDLSLSLLKKTDVREVIDRRRSNADALSQGLRDISDVITLPAIDLQADVPLFLPVFLENGLRNSLREYLIERGVYCPVHWPEVMGAPAGIRENELSLICDQRYSKTDMLAIIEIIHAWYETIRKE